MYIYKIGRGAETNLAMHVVGWWWEEREGGWAGCLGEGGRKKSSAVPASSCLAGKSFSVLYRGDNLGCYTSLDEAPQHRANSVVAQGFRPRLPL